MLRWLLWPLEVSHLGADGGQAKLLINSLNRNQAIVTYKSQAPTLLSCVLPYLREFLEKKSKLIVFWKGVVV